MAQDAGHCETWPPSGKGEGDTLSSSATDGHVREEGPPSGWRLEGLSPSNRRRPRSGGGGVPWRGGRGQRPVHHRVRGWQHLPHSRTLARRDPGWQAAARGGGAKRPRPKHPSPGAPWRLVAPRPSGGRAGHPPPQPAPRPSFAGAARRRLPGSAPLFPSLPRPPLTRHPFFLFLR